MEIKKLTVGQIADLEKKQSSELEDSNRKYPKRTKGGTSCDEQLSRPSATGLGEIK